MAVLKTGDVINVGSCKINVVAPPEGYEFCVEVEQPRAGQNGRKPCNPVQRLARSNQAQQTWFVMGGVCRVVCRVFPALAGFMIEGLREPLRATTI